MKFNKKINSFIPKKIIYINIKLKENLLLFFYLNKKL